MQYYLYDKVVEYKNKIVIYNKCVRVAGIINEFLSLWGKKTSEKKKNGSSRGKWKRDFGNRSDRRDFS